MNDYLIMHKDTIIAECKNDKLEIIEKQLLPYLLLKSESIDLWLKTRAIDRHRTNSRLLKKALRLTEKDDTATAISVHGVTITDNYWVKSAGSDLKYADVMFDSDYFSELALTGNYDSFTKAAEHKNKKTPELTNIGSYEKCWKLINGEWWLFKVANELELFSELFAYKLGIKIGFNMAEYKKDSKYICTRNFVNLENADYEPAYNYVGDDDSYDKFIDFFNTFEPSIIPDFIKLIFMDTLIANPDRHTFNFGVLRSSNTGKIISLAPNFDNNMALISRGYPSSDIRKDDILIKLFKDVVNQNDEYMRLIPEVTKELVSEAIDETGISVNKEFIINYVMSSYQRIIE